MFHTVLVDGVSIQEQAVFNALANFDRAAVAESHCADCVLLRFRRPFTVIVVVIVAVSV